MKHQPFCSARSRALSLRRRSGIHGTHDSSTYRHFFGEVSRQTSTTLPPSMRQTVGQQELPHPAASACSAREGVAHLEWAHRAPPRVASEPSGEILSRMFPAGRSDSGDAPLPPDRDDAAGEATSRAPVAGVCAPASVSACRCRSLCRPRCPAPLAGSTLSSIRLQQNLAATAPSAPIEWLPVMESRVRVSSRSIRLKGHARAVLQQCDHRHGGGVVFIFIGSDARWLRRGEHLAAAVAAETLHLEHGRRFQRRACPTMRISVFRLFLPVYSSSRHSGQGSPGLSCAACCTGDFFRPGKGAGCIAPMTSRRGRLRGLSCRRG